MLRKVEAVTKKRGARVILESVEAPENCTLDEAVEITDRLLAENRDFVNECNYLLIFFDLLSENEEDIAMGFIWNNYENYTVSVTNNKKEEVYSNVIKKEGK